MSFLPTTRALIIYPLIVFGVAAFSPAGVFSPARANSFWRCFSGCANVFSVDIIAPPIVFGVAAVNSARMSADLMKREIIGYFQL
jgi:hypothetical protein